MNNRADIDNNFLPSRYCPAMTGFEPHPDDVRDDRLQYHLLLCHARSPRGAHALLQLHFQSSGDPPALRSLWCLLYYRTAAHLPHHSFIRRRGVCYHHDGEYFILLLFFVGVSIMLKS